MGLKAPENKKLFTSLTKTHLILAFIALMLLRIVVGYHFFVEGSSKLQDKYWTAEYFLKGAKGPAAPLFHQMVDDEKGNIRLCVDEQKTEAGETKYFINTDLADLLWKNFLDITTQHYGFNDPDEIKALQAKREELAKTIQAARESGDKSVDTNELGRKRREDEATIKAMRNQVQRADELRKAHFKELQQWLEANETELLAHYVTEDRLTGFERDGVNRSQVALNVDSIRYQVDTVRADRAKQLAGWNAEVGTIWDSFESSINDLAVGKQLEKDPVELHRPFDQPNSKLKIINKVIPWFDTIVGALLILGLFSRLASAAGGLFLLSVIISQPPWIPGTQDTFYQAIEMFAMFVIFATCAGRYGGLDFFFSQPSTPDPESEVA